MTGDIFTDTQPCSKCKSATAIVDLFPGKLCLKCYSEKMEHAPLEKPDFVAAVKSRKR
jgi:hypothetical protein